MVRRAVPHSAKLPLLQMIACAAAVASLAVACSADATSDLVDEQTEDSGAKKDAATAFDSSTENDSGATTTDSWVTPDAGPSTTGENKNLGNSAGCGKAGAGKGLQTRKMTIGGASRDYLRFIPNGYDPAKPMPLIFALHGSGGTADAARSGFDLEAEAGGKAIFIYPQGLPYDPNFPGVNRWQTANGSDDFAFIDALLAEVESSHCIDRDRVFMTGFSHGARMTSMVGCFRGDKFRAIAPVAPGGDNTTLPLGGCVGEVGLWIAIGDQDAEHQPGTDIVKAYYTGANGCTQATTTTTPKGCAAYQGCRADVPVTSCGFAGGHMWPTIGAPGVWGFFSAMK